MRKVSLSSLLLVAILIFSAAVTAGDYPDRPINVVVQYSAGGGTDTMIRAICNAIEENTDWKINVTNMPGADGALASDFVAKKPADGYWLLGLSMYDRSLRVMDYVDFTPWKVYQYFTMGKSIQSFGVKKDSPLKTFDDFLELARSDKNVNVSNSGIGGLWHLGLALTVDKAGIDVEDVPYTGGAPATLAAVKGEVDLAASGLHEQIEFIKAGEIRPLAVMTKEPVFVEGYGEIPPVSDFVAGLDDFLPYGGIYSLAVRKDTPVEIQQEIQEKFLMASESAKLKELFEKKFFTLAPVVGSAANREAAINEIFASGLLWELGVGEVDPATLDIPELDGFNDWWPPTDYEEKL